MFLGMGQFDQVLWNILEHMSQKSEGVLLERVTI